MKLLVISARFPLPLEKGDKLRLYHQLKYLARDHEVFLISLADEEIEEKWQRDIESFCQKTYIFSQSYAQHVFNALRGLCLGMPVNVGYFYQPSIKRRIHQLVGEIDPTAIYVQLIRMVPYVKDLQVPFMGIDYMDSFSLRIQRRVELGGLTSLFWRLEKAMLTRFELSCAKYFDSKFIISDVDKQHLESQGIDGLTLLRNGVDIEYYRVDQDRKAQKEYDILLVGNMSYHPNILAAKYLVEQIAVPLRRKLPNLKLLIAGASPSPQVTRLQNDWIHVTGYMPDIRDAYANARIFVAPIFAGSGLQNKILEAMAMGLPCVTSSLVNDSICAPAEAVREANDPAAFIDAVWSLLQHGDLDKYGNVGRAFVKEHFGWEGCSVPLKNLGAYHSNKSS
ncbi:MAG: glycosyltransferase [Saprospiraceae bacterium]|nr:glycosyltransferase [Saprospiraceae bacterium]